MRDLLKRLTGRPATRRSHVKTRTKPGILGTESLESRLLLAAQVVTATAAESTLAFGNETVVELRYDVTDPLAADPLLLGLQVRYNSDVLKFAGTTEVLNDGDLLKVEDQAESTPDGDPNTNRAVTFSWQDVVNGWPGTSGNRGTNVLLGKVRFTALQNAATTTIKLTGDSDMGYDFTGNQATVTVVPPTFLVGQSLTLAEAITAANAASTPAILQFDTSQPAIALTTELPQITNSITFDGPGADKLTITAAANSRVFNVAAGATVNIKGMTLTGGNVTGSGGAILNDGRLTLNGVRLVGNTASEDGGAIAGIGSLEVSNSEISGNTAGRDSGAILVSSAAIIVNSTISGNTSVRHAGGVAVNAGGTLTLRNSTVVSNTSNFDRSGGGTAGGLLQVGSGTLTLHNTIVAGNIERMDGAGEVRCDIIGTAASASSNNLVSDHLHFGGLETANGNIIGDGSGSDLELAAILNPSHSFSGGTTQSHALADGSPAIDKGSNAQALSANAFALATDQRGRARIAGAQVDIGAYEVVPAADFTITNPVSTSVVEGSSVSLQVVLDAPPVNTVVIKLTSSDPSEAKPRFSSVIFSSNNWNVPQPVPIDGVVDGEVDGDKTSTITVSVDQAASDDAFDSLPDHTFTVTTTDDGTTASSPADADGNGVFDARDSFLINLRKSGGLDSHIEAAKGASPLTAEQIRLKIDSLGLTFDVDGNAVFDARDSFLINLRKSGGLDSHIEAAKGASPLTAAEIRGRIDNLGNAQSSSTAGASMPSVIAAVQKADEINALQSAALPASEQPQSVGSIWDDDDNKWLDHI